jgi:Uma2 family endonuclease
VITTPGDLLIYSAPDFERLPEEGLWEVAEGRAVLLPGNEFDHQEISIGLVKQLLAELQRRGQGQLLTTVNVDIPALPGETFRTRVPDIVVYERRPSGKRFAAGEPPEIAIEVLSSPRGNVERTEKLDDYARAGIAEYWIVDPFERAIEIYRLQAEQYKLVEIASEQVDSEAMQGVRIDVPSLWRSRE